MRSDIASSADGARLGLRRVRWQATYDIEDEEHDLVEADENQGGYVFGDDLAERVWDLLRPFEGEETEELELRQVVVEGFRGGDVEEEGGDNEVEDNDSPKATLLSFARYVLPVQVKKVWGEFYCFIVLKYARGAEVVDEDEGVSRYLEGLLEAGVDFPFNLPDLCGLEVEEGLFDLDQVLFVAKLEAPDFELEEASVVRYYIDFHNFPGVVLLVEVLEDVEHGGDAFEIVEGHVANVEGSQLHADFFVIANDFKVNVLHLFPELDEHSEDHDQKERADDEVFVGFDVELNEEQLVLIQKSFKLSQGLNAQISKRKCDQSDQHLSLEHNQGESIETAALQEVAPGKVRHNVREDDPDMVEILAQKCLIGLTFEIKLAAKQIHTIKLWYQNTIEPYGFPKKQRNRNQTTINQKGRSYKEQEIQFIVLMIFHKYKRGIQFLFALKHLVHSALGIDILMIVISTTTLIVLTLFLVRKNNFLLKQLRIALLLELVFHDPPFAPLIVAIVNLNIQYRIMLFVFYTVRMATIYFEQMQIVDWVFYGVQFFVLTTYLYCKDFKTAKEKPQVIVSTPKQLYHNITTESTEMGDIFNILPVGICILDSHYNVTSSNTKARKYVQSGNNECFQTQLYSALQKVCLFQNNLNLATFKKHDPRCFESIDDISSDFQLKRLQSFSQPRIRAWSQQRQTNNFNDIGTIIQKYKMPRQDQGSPGLKYKDTKMNKVFEYLIYEVAQGYAIIIQNKTKQEDRLEMCERYRFQSMLINSFSHELRTPLNCSMQLLQILDQQIKPILSEKYLRPALISNQRLLHQINDILDFANFEARTFKIRPGLFQLEQLSSKLYEYFKWECEKKQVKFQIKTCSNVTISSDYDRVMQILVNLMSNSIKFTNDGGEIHFTVNRVGQYYQFEVYDTGCGIPLDKLYLIQKILQNQSLDFQKRGDEEYFQYVGLGLKVSSQIARKLCDAGELSITSNQGQFTRVSFIIKDFKSEDLALTIPSDTYIQEPYKSRTKFKCQCAHILICDDVPFNHIALQTVLSYYKIKSDSAYDGQMAVDAVRNKFVNCNCGYKVIFMDIEMPNMDGFQASKEICQIMEQKKSPFVIVMCSAYDSKENLDCAYRSGMREVLPKPVEVGALKKLLNKYYF